MKKFVSILTVVAMVAAISTSAFAAVSGGDPTAPQGVPTNTEEQTNNWANDPEKNQDNDETIPTDDGVVNPPADNGQGQNTPPANNGQGQDNPPVNNGQGQDTPPVNNGQGQDTPPVNNGQGGNTGDTNDSNPNADASKLTALAQKVAEALNGDGELTFDNVEEKVTFFATLLGLDPEDLPEDFNVVTNALNLKDATGVKIEKNDDGTLFVTVGQNQLTPGHIDDLLAFVASTFEGEKSEVCKVELDKNGNLTFTTKINSGVFFLVIETGDAQPVA